MHAHVLNRQRSVKSFTQQTIKLANKQLTAAQTFTQVGIPNTKHTILDERWWGESQ